MEAGAQRVVRRSVRCPSLCLSFLPPIPRVIFSEAKPKNHVRNRGSFLAPRARLSRRAPARNPKPCIIAGPTASANGSVPTSGSASVMHASASSTFLRATSLSRAKMSAPISLSTVSSTTTREFSASSSPRAQPPHPLRQRDRSPSLRGTRPPLSAPASRRVRLRPLG